MTHEIIFWGYFQSRKNSFFFYWIKLNSNILPYVFVKKNSEIFKTPELIRKTYFQTRVNKSGRCRSLVHERIPWGRLILGLVFHVICIFCLHRAFDKIHTWKLFDFGKIFAHGKIKSGRKSLVKKKKKGPKEKEREPFRQEKENNPLWKRLVLVGAPCWRPGFEQRSRRQTKICHT